MKTLRVKIKDELKDELYEILRSSQFYQSNPDQNEGEYLDIYMKDKQLIFGYDLFLRGDEHTKIDIRKRDDLMIIVDWIDDL